MNDDFSQSFVFSYKEGSVTLVKQEQYEEGVTWPVVLESFLNFLEASGYVGVKNKVRIQENPFVESDWSLGTFDKEEEAYWE